MSDLASPRQPSGEDLAKIDELCDEFESAWKSESVPQIGDYLAKASPLPDSLQTILLRHLVMLDLEYQWRRGGASTSPRLLEYYQQRFPQLAGSEPAGLPLEMAAQEYRIRVRWGDQPRYEEYYQRFCAWPLGPPAATPEEINKRLDEVLERQWPTLIKVFQPGPRGRQRPREPVFQTPLTAVMEIGRQRKNEPPPIVASDNMRGKRLIIADRTERIISRRHLMTQLQASGEIRLENLSEKNSVIYEHAAGAAGASCVLPPGEQVTLTAPALIGTGDKLLRLARLG